MVLLLLTLALFAIVMLAMSVGVLVTGRCLRGSCGGPAILDGDGEPITCATCPNRDRLKEEALLGLQAQAREGVIR